MIQRLAATLLLLTTALIPEGQAQTGAISTGPTLAAARARGQVACGISTGDPAWSQPDSRGEWQGMDADFCRAVAAAVLGDGRRVAWHPLTGQNRFPTLATGQIDLLSRTTTITYLRDVTNGLNFATPNFYDGQGFLVRSDSGVTRAEQLNGASICFTSASTHELNLQDWSRAHNIRFTPVIFADKDEARRAFEAGRCDSFTGDSSQLAAIRAAFPNPEAYTLLPERISKEPYAAAVRHGDDQWFDIVKWVAYGLIEAEELGVTQANVDEMLNSPRPAVRRLLGQTGELGPALGLDRRWIYNAIKAVGNYGEIYDRHLGANSQVRLPRGLNALWNQGGMMFSPPLR